MKPQIFITGGSGYIGSRLIKKLLEEGGYRIHALVRRGSENKLPEGCNIIYGNALDAGSYKYGIPNGSVFIHLVGVPNPSPAKKELFKKIDWVSIQQAVSAARDRHVSHFIYLSVSQYPLRIMREYQLVRAAGEALLKQSGFGASIIPSWAAKAKHFDTVTIEQMINTLMVAVKNTAAGIKHYEIDDIRQQQY